MTLSLAEKSRPGLGGLRLAWSIGALISVAFALVSYRYVAGLGPAPEVVAGNGHFHPWIAIHVTGAATAMLVAPFQFLPGLRARRRGLHRLLGRIYVVGCLVGGASGFILALGASTGPISTAGFGTLAVLWIATTGLAWRRAMQGRIQEHRQWMIRSVALTLAAITLRLYLPVAIALPFSFEDSYRAISFLCWVPNLLIAEAHLRRRATN